MTPARSLVLGISVVMGAFLVGCGEEAPDSGSLVEPDLASKADVARGVARLGAVDFSRHRDAAFKRDLEFHGYNFVVGAGASVKLDVTHTGSSATLDTTLFLYGPKNGSGGYGSRIQQDDDTGWGKLSRLTTAPLLKGEYMVVVGTKDGLGRGNYRLALSCGSGVCGGETLRLSEVALPTELAQRSEKAWENCDPCGIGVTVYKYSYPGVANLPQVVRTVRGKLEKGAEWSEEGFAVTPKVAADTFTNSYLDDFLEPLKDFIGADGFEGVSLLFDGSTDDGWNLYATTLILHFPAQQRIVTLYFGQISG